MSFRSAFAHRDELLAAALDEFCQCGYDAASINRILTESGVSKGQLYHHFDGKKGLYLALVEWMLDEKTAWLMAHHAGPDEDFVDALGSQIRASLEFAGSRPDVERMSRSLLAERGRPIFDVVVQRFGFTPESALAQLVDDHFRRGRFRPEFSVDFVRRAVLLLVNHAAELLDLDEPKDLEPKIGELLTLLRAGLMLT